MHSLQEGLDELLEVLGVGVLLQLLLVTLHDRHQRVVVRRFVELQKHSK